MSFFRSTNVEIRFRRWTRDDFFFLFRRFVFFFRSFVVAERKTKLNETEKRSTNLNLIWSRKTRFSSISRISSIPSKPKQFPENETNFGSRKVFVVFFFDRWDRRFSTSSDSERLELIRDRLRVEFHCSRDKVPRRDKEKNFETKRKRCVFSFYLKISVWNDRSSNGQRAFRSNQRWFEINYFQSVQFADRWSEFARRCCYCVVIQVENTKISIFNKSAGQSFDSDRSNSILRNPNNFQRSDDLIYFASRFKIDFSTVSFFFYLKSFGQSLSAFVLQSISSGNELFQCKRSSRTCATVFMTTNQSVGE